MKKYILGFIIGSAMMLTLPALANTIADKQFDNLRNRIRRVEEMTAILYSDTNTIEEAIATQTSEITTLQTEVLLQSGQIARLCDISGHLLKDCQPQ